jgi:hypothetical protein
MSSATPTHAGPASEFLFLLCTFWRHGASPHNPAATPDTAPSRHCARSQGRNKPHQGRPSTGQETRFELHRLAEPKRWDTAQSPGAGASQPGNSKCPRSFGSAQPQRRRWLYPRRRDDDITTTSRAGDGVHSLASWLQLCGVQQAGVGENGPELDLETRTAMRPHETAVQHPSAGRESSRRLYYYAAGSPP